MIAGETQYMGCGMVIQFRPNRTSNQILVCNYGPATQFIKQQGLYQWGQPCSACPQGFECSADKHGLCIGKN